MEQLLRDLFTENDSVSDGVSSLEPVHPLSQEEIRERYQTSLANYSEQFAACEIAAKAKLLDSMEDAFCKYRLEEGRLLVYGNQLGYGMADIEIDKKNMIGIQRQGRRLS